MTAIPDGKFALRVPAILYWMLGIVVTGVQVLASSSVFSVGWSLAISVVNAMITIGLLTSQPKRQPDDPMGPTPPQARRPPLVRRYARRASRGALLFVLPIVVGVVGGGCGSLLGSRSAVSPSVFSACPPDKACEDIAGVPSDTCVAIDDAHEGFTVAAEVAGGLAGGTAIVNPLLEYAPESERDRWRLGVSISSAIFGIASGTFGGLASWEAGRFVQWCGGSPP